MKSKVVIVMCVNVLLESAAIEQEMLTHATIVSAGNNLPKYFTLILLATLLILPVEI